MAANLAHTKKARANNKNVTPTPTQGLFRFNSPGRNRALYLTLLVMDELNAIEQVADIRAIYVNSGLPWWTIRCALAKWVRWQYLFKMGKRYKVAGKGTYKIARLDMKIPGITALWRSEMATWRQGLPELTDWRPSALYRQLEPLRWHRPGHSGASLYSIGGIYWRIKDNTDTERLILCPKPSYKKIYSMPYKSHTKLNESLWTGYSYLEPICDALVANGMTAESAKKLVEQSWSLLLDGR